jgi:asparagine synthase (glutamine-hydrolysing)
MCGIAGVVDFKGRFSINQQTLENMAKPLRYRGPDQDGYFIGSTKKCQFGFAHKRLSIIDLSETGRQPMRSIDGRFVIVFNGEIYNYKAIKSELPSSLIYTSHSDTEVILKAYQFWGIQKTLDKLEGMFAFAIFDQQLDVTILARDRFGEKPLYYHYSDGSLAFSSDIRTFDAINIKKTLDSHALGYYFTELGTPLANSIWQEIKKLPPAHFLSFDDHKIDIEQYWSPNYTFKTKDSFQESVFHIEELLEQSVKSRLVADVPVGCFLSGGLDSSLIALFAAKHCSGKLNTFSVGFEFEAFNELPYALEVAKMIGSNHHEIVLQSNDLNIVNDLLAEYGEPFADSSQIPTHYVSKFAAQSVKAVLGGDGGDEIFGGYGTHNQAYRMQQWWKMRNLSPLISLLQNTGNWKKTTYINNVLNRDINTLASALDRGMGFSSSQLRLLLKDSVAISATNVEHKQIINQALKIANGIYDPILYACIKSRLVNDYFVKTDRASMFNSLELRTPYMDRNLTEYVSTLPYTYLRKNGVSKCIPKTIASKYFSEKFVSRRKQGFAIPIGEWIRKEWNSHFLEVIAQKQNLIELDYLYVDKLISEHMSRKHDHSHRLWTIFVFHHWAQSQR